MATNKMKEREDKLEERHTELDDYQKELEMREEALVNEEQRLNSHLEFRTYFQSFGQHKYRSSHHRTEFKSYSEFSTS